MNTAVTSSRTHRTQAERSERTREQLFAATIDCLLDLGYAARRSTRSASGPACRAAPNSTTSPPRPN